MVKESTDDIRIDLWPFIKVIGDVQGQSYTKHAISALLLPVETQVSEAESVAQWLGCSPVMQESGVQSPTQAAGIQGFLEVLLG